MVSVNSIVISCVSICFIVFLTGYPVQSSNQLLVIASNVKQLISVLHMQSEGWAHLGSGNLELRHFYATKQGKTWPLAD